MMAPYALIALLSLAAPLAEVLRNISQRMTIEANTTKHPSLGSGALLYSQFMLFSF